VKFRDLYKIFVGCPEWKMTINEWKDDRQQILKKYTVKGQIGFSWLKIESKVKLLSTLSYHRQLTSGFHMSGNVMFIQVPQFLKEGY
jgi:hypothetical protein